MVNLLGKFIPELDVCNEPLRQLLRSDNVWLWSGAPVRLSHTTIPIALRSPQQMLRLQESARSCYKCMTSTSVVQLAMDCSHWACEKFSEYVLRSKLTLDTDHRPLIPLLNSTELCKMPPRIQIFRLRLVRFVPLVQYVPGKQQTTADLPSRAPVESPASYDEVIVAEVEAFVSRARQ